MQAISNAAAERWKLGDRAGARKVAEDYNRTAHGFYTNANDFEFAWPQESNSELVITFHPDADKGLTDARMLEFRTDLESGEYETSEYYPASFRFVAFALIGILGGAAFLLARWGARPFHRPTRHDRLIAAKHMQGEWDAMQTMARIRTRE